jgi:hypothetical protein
VGKKGWAVAETSAKDYTQVSSCPQPTGISSMKKTHRSKETIYAFILVIVIITLLIVTTDQSPEWIYQGF